MSPFWSPPHKEPYSYVRSIQQGDQLNAPLSRSQEALLPHSPQLRICIADRRGDTQIFQLQGRAREEAIKACRDEFLRQLGITSNNRDIVVRAEDDSHNSELTLIISFLSLAVVTVEKAADAIKSIADSASAWAKLLEGLPAVLVIIRRAMGLGRRISYNELMLLDLTINYARMNGYSGAMPIDLCYVEPIQYLVSMGRADLVRRDMLGILLCDTIPRPNAFHGFIVNRSGQLLAYGRRSRRVLRLTSNQARSYELMQNAAHGASSHLDVEGLKRMGVAVPPFDLAIKRSKLRAGVFTRAHGAVNLWPGKRARIELRGWPSVNMTLSSGRQLVN